MNADQKKPVKERKSKFVIPICVILIVTACSFAPAVKNDFINWDDPAYVTKNVYLSRITLKNVKALLTSPFVGTYQPIVNLSFLLERHFFDLNASYYHATNVLLHCLNCLLVFWILMLLFNDLPASLLATLLFGLHPLRVESVAWVSERKDVLYSFFFLWSLVMYSYYAKKRSIKFYYGSIFLFLLSLGSKAMAATLPILLFGIDYIFKRTFSKKTLYEKVPFFALALVFGIIAIFAQGASLKVGHGEHLHLSHQILAGFYGAGMYIYKTIFPANLSIIYPYPTQNMPYYLVSFFSIILISLVVGAVILAKPNRKIIFCLLFTSVTILPVLQFIPVGDYIMADRYTYLPSIGISYLISMGVFYLYRKEFKYGAALKIVLVVALTFALATLGILTYKRTEVWKDSITIFNDAIKKYPQAYMAHNNLGLAHQEKNELDKALVNFHDSLKARGGQFRVYNNLGTLYYDMNMYEESIDALKKAMSINPNFAEGYNNLGNSYSAIGRKDEAIKSYKKALEINPNFAQAYNNLGTEYLDKHKAISAYKKAIELNPGYADAYYNLSVTYRAIGQEKNAARAYKKAKRLNPRIP